jgi:hypothetical protein
MKRWFIILAVSWILFHAAVYLIVPSIIPYLGFFPYKEIAIQYHLPPFFTSMANFDGVHYLGIAKSGYNQYEQAFFPLYPLTIFMLSYLLGGNFLLAGFLISSVSFFVGLFFFKQYLKEILEHPKHKTLLPSWRWAQLLLLAFPTSFFFTTVYTEGLFFLLFVLSLYCLKKERYSLAAVFGFLASLTRLAGVFLIIPFALDFLKKIQWKLHIHNFKKRWPAIVPIFTPLIGLAVYCSYLWKTTGDPLFFLNAQSAFGANRSSHLMLFPVAIYRYIKIFLTAQWNFQYFISVVEFVCFSFVFIVLAYELFKIIRNRTSPVFYERLSLNLFSLANLLLPTFTGTFSSIPRYVLLSLSFFVTLGEIKNVYVKASLVTLFGLMHLLLFGFFMQGYFVG